jgi:hypothetical protein
MAATASTNKILVIRFIVSPRLTSGWNAAGDYGRAMIVGGAGWDKDFEGSVGRRRNKVNGGLSKQRPYGENRNGPEGVGAAKD